MLGALLGAAGSVVSGLLGKDAADDAAAANRRLNEQQFTLGKKNIALQKEFAKQGIRWKVADAKKAGIHPLYALGAQTTSFSPVSVGSIGASPDYSMANMASNLGQDLSRAANATRTAPERIDAYTKSAQLLTLQKMGLENELLASQIARINQQTNPPMASLADEFLPYEEVNKDPEGHTPLMFWGRRIPQHKGTSNAQAFQDWVGDEGPLAWVAGVPGVSASIAMILQRMAERSNLYVPESVRRRIQYERR